MTDDNPRFKDEFSSGLMGKQPLQLLQLFNVGNVQDMLKVAKITPTDIQSLQAEVREYLSPLCVQLYLSSANSQTNLPVECAFALQVYSRSHVFEDVNELLHNGGALHKYQRLCICLIKGLVLLPPFSGRAFRQAGIVQAVNVCHAKNQN